MMLLKDFLEVNHINFQVVVRNNSTFIKISDTEFYGEETGYNFARLRGYLYDPIIDIKMVSFLSENGCATNILGVIVLHEYKDECGHEGKEKEDD